MSEDIEIKLNLNDIEVRATVKPQTILADLIRDEFHLTGTKIACDQAVCGACT